MIDDFNSTDYQDVVPLVSDAIDQQYFMEAPSHLDVLPDGREAIVVGDPEGAAQFNHKQGDNFFGAKGDCGLVSCEDLLRQFGLPVNENDIVLHAAINGDCDLCDDPNKKGASSPENLAKILSDYGVAAHPYHSGTLESLAANIEGGHGVIIGVNAGVLWDDKNAYEQGQANHAVVVTGVAIDPLTNEVEGFYINDSGTGKSNQFVDATTMHKAWQETGGQSVVTDGVHFVQQAQ